MAKITVYKTIIILPLLSSLMATNRKCGYITGPILSVLCKNLAAIQTLIVFYEVGLNGSPVNVVLGNWIDYGNILIEWNFLFDGLTVAKYLPIVIISFLIQIYSLSYMGSDPAYFLGRNITRGDRTIKFRKYLKANGTKPHSKGCEWIE